MIDSPHAEVREAVQESLQEFTFTRYLANFDLMDDQIRRNSGRLVLKVECLDSPNPAGVRTTAEPDSRKCQIEGGGATSTNVCFASDTEKVDENEMPEV